MLKKKREETTKAFHNLTIKCSHLLSQLPSSADGVNPTLSPYHLGLPFFLNNKKCLKECQYHWWTKNLNFGWNSDGKSPSTSRARNEDSKFDSSRCGDDQTKVAAQSSDYVTVHKPHLKAKLAKKHVVVQWWKDSLPIGSGGSYWGSLSVLWQEQRWPHLCQRVQADPQELGRGCQRRGESGSGLLCKRASPILFRRSEPSSENGMEMVMATLTLPSSSRPWPGETSSWSISSAPFANWSSFRILTDIDSEDRLIEAFKLFDKVWSMIAIQALKKLMHVFLYRITMASSLQQSCPMSWPHSATTWIQWRLWKWSKKQISTTTAKFLFKSSKSWCTPKWFFSIHTTLLAINETNFFQCLLCKILVGRSGSSFLEQYIHNGHTK